MSSDNEAVEPSVTSDNNTTLNRITTTRAEQHSIRISPIPTPEDFEGYKRVMPDLPERILKQFEEDSRANRELQKEEQAANIELNKKEQIAEIAFKERSQWMAFSFIMTGLLGTLFLAYHGKDIAALGTGATTFALIFKGVFTKE